MILHSGETYLNQVNGSELDSVTGDVSQLHKGQDASIVGDEPSLVVDLQSMVDYVWYV